MSLVTFATYVLTGDDHELTVEKAFGALILFDIIKMPLAMFPLVLVYIVEVKLVDLNIFFLFRPIIATCTGCGNFFYLFFGPTNIYFSSSKYG